MKNGTYILGLTGSIGMGKSTTANFFREFGVPVWDADAAVHALYAQGGAGVAAIGAIVPEATVSGSVDRNTLREHVLNDAALLKRVEATIHPLVAADRQAFLARHAGEKLVVLDIPLLFETGAQAWLDGVLVVSAAPEVQRARVFERPGMTDAIFDSIMAKQMPDADKRAKADFVIDTGQGMETARKAVQDLIQRITGENDA
ncbi:MAG TPA: dephospho-CoA kinase [Paracoccaceae bacterium]|nr:dephospho-CoA kinase [Paracoccaceae bacterium]